MVQTAIDDDFIRLGFEYFQKGQTRSLISTIESVLEASPIRTPAILVETDAIFPKDWSFDPPVGRFQPEVYACVDQLMIALTLAATELHRVSESIEDIKERERLVTVAEVLKCLSTHIFAIRKLSLTGFVVQVRQIIRTFLEYVELLALVCADQSALDEFIASGQSEEANAFWHRHLSKSKARNRRLLMSTIKSGLPRETQEASRQWHEDNLLLMSESAHPTLGSVIASGRIFTDGSVRPNEPDAVIGALIYAFTAFADALEVPTLEFLSEKLDYKNDERGRDICQRFYLIFTLAVMLGYRKDYIFFGESQVEKDLELATKSGAGLT